MMNGIGQTFFILGCLSAGLSVALGAFGAHALKERLPAARISTFEASWAAGAWPVAPLVTIAGWLFTSGTILFSGSLYLLAVSNRRWIGAATPLGGLAFIGGWLCLAFVALSGQSDTSLFNIK